MSSGWTAVATLADFDAADAIGVTAGGRQVAIYLVDGQPFATADRCTHGNAALCEGFLDGFEIECPFHQGRFDVRTGLATGAPAVHALAVYPARLDGDRISIDLG